MDTKSRGSSYGFGSSSQNSLPRIMEKPNKKMRLHLGLPLMNFTSATRRISSFMKLKKDINLEPIGCDKCTLHKLKNEFQCNSHKISARPPLPRPKGIKELSLKNIIKKQTNPRHISKYKENEECIELSQFSSSRSNEDTELHVKQSIGTNEALARSIKRKLENFDRIMLNN